MARTVPRPVIPATRRVRWVDLRFKVDLGYIASLWLSGRVLAQVWVKPPVLGVGAEIELSSV